MAMWQKKDSISMMSFHRHTRARRHADTQTRRHADTHKRTLRFEHASLHINSFTDCCCDKLILFKRAYAKKKTKNTTPRLAPRHNYLFTSASLGQLADSQSPQNTEKESRGGQSVKDKTRSCKQKAIKMKISKEKLERPICGANKNALITACGC